MLIKPGTLKVTVEYIELDDNNNELVQREIFEGFDTFDTSEFRGMEPVYVGGVLGNQICDQILTGERTITLTLHKRGR